MKFGQSKELLTKAVTLLFALVLIFVVSATFVLAETARIKTGFGNTVVARAGAYDGAAVRVRIPAGKEVRVVIQSGSFTKVAYRGVEGWVKNERLEFPAIQLIVLNPLGATGFTKGNYPERGVVNVDFGSIVTLRGRYGKATEVAFSNGTEALNIVVPSKSVSQCFVSSNDTYTIQFHLNKLGYHAGPSDGVMGSKTRRAIQSFFDDAGLDPQALSQACQKVIIETRASKRGEELKNAHADQEFLVALEEALAPDTLRRKWRAAEKAFEELRCADLRDLPELVLRGLSVETCLKTKERNAETKLAASYFEGRECSQLMLVPEEYRVDFPLERCRSLKVREEKMALLMATLEQEECEAAAALSNELSALSQEVAHCRAVVQRKADEAALTIAVVKKDCEAVEGLEAKLGLTGAYETCRFTTAIEATTARQMFLAAGQYDANDDRARAKLLYSEIVKRFPEDDLALQAVSRLTSINDLERSDEARREMEAEMARLKREAEEAQRKAEEAQRQAERARAEAERRAATTTARPARSACSHVYRGKRVQIIPDAPSNPKQALGFIFQGGLYGTNFEVTGVGPSEATLYSLDTGRSIQIHCSQVP